MRNVIKTIKFYWGILFDKDTPTIARILLVGAIAYLFLPFDIIPDFSLIVGQFDDLVVIPTLFYIATRFVPEEVIQRHKRIKL